MKWRNPFAWLDPRGWFDFPDFGTGGFGVVPLERQLFISKSGSRKDADRWITLIDSAVDKQFNLMWDDQFRLVEQEDPKDHWRRQFTFTRASYAMVVLTGPDEWMSRGQDIEVEDAMGRRIPIAMCRVEPFKWPETNEMFLEWTREPEEKARYRCVRYFDLAGADMHGELARMVSWLRTVACEPPQLPAFLDAGCAKEIQAVIRVPDGDGWRAIDWSTYRPLLVANYGPHFSQLGTSIRYQSRPKQLLFPVTTGAAGEMRATVTLPSSGVGHMALTLGEPEPGYADDDGGMIHIRCYDLLLWWDFVVAAK